MYEFSGAARQIGGKRANFRADFEQSSLCPSRVSGSLFLQSRHIPCLFSRRRRSYWISYSTADFNAGRVGLASNLTRAHCDREAICHRDRLARGRNPHHIINQQSRSYIHYLSGPGFNCETRFERRRFQGGGHGSDEGQRAASPTCTISS